MGTLNKSKVPSAAGEVSIIGTSTYMKPMAARFRYTEGWYTRSLGSQPDFLALMAANREGGSDPRCVLAARRPMDHSTKPSVARVRITVHADGAVIIQRTQFG